MATNTRNTILDLLKMIFYFLYGKFTIWGIYREYVLFSGGSLSKSMPFFWWQTSPISWPQETYAMMGINLEVMLQEMRASADVLPAAGEPGDGLLGLGLSICFLFRSIWWLMMMMMRMMIDDDDDDDDEEEEEEDLAVVLATILAFWTLGNGHRYTQLNKNNINASVWRWSFEPCFWWWFPNCGRFKMNLKKGEKERPNLINTSLSNDYD